MRQRLLELIGVVSVIIAVIGLLKLTSVSVAGQAPTSGAKTSPGAKAGPAPKT